MTEAAVLRPASMALISLIAILAGASPAVAHIQVGVRGCADDVQVRASRALITFESRDRPPRRRIPVLMIRAENDTHVLPRNTATWVDFLREHDIPVRVEVIAGAGHLFRSPEWSEIFTRASTFYGDNIGRPSQ